MVWGTRRVSPAFFGGHIIQAVKKPGWEREGVRRWDAMSGLACKSGRSQHMTQTISFHLTELLGGPARRLHLQPVRAEGDRRGRGEENEHWSKQVIRRCRHRGDGEKTHMPGRAEQTAPSLRPEPGPGWELGVPWSPLVPSALGQVEWGRDSDSDGGVTPSLSLQNQE